MLDFIRDIVWISDNIKDPSGEFHNAKRMLKPLMCCARINKISHCQLVNMTQSLERTGIKNSTFVAVQTNEHMDWVSNFVSILH